MISHGNQLMTENNHWLISMAYQWQRNHVAVAINQYNGSNNNGI